MKQNKKPFNIMRKCAKYEKKFALNERQADIMTTLSNLNALQNLLSNSEIREKEKDFNEILDYFIMGTFTDLETLNTVQKCIETAKDVYNFVNAEMKKTQKNENQTQESI